MAEFSTQHEDDHVQHERKINSIIAPEDVDKILCKNVSDLSIIEDSCIITPRSYQYEMLEESLKKNIILAFIWFLAPTVTLSRQHFENIKLQITSVEKKFICGDDKVELWVNQSHWDSILHNISIVVSTYQILTDALTHGFVKMKDLALIIFDEAHNCVGNSPGAKIMNHFYHPRKATGKYVPCILGLTASPVMGSKVSSLIQIEKTLDALSRTPTKTRTALQRSVNRPVLSQVHYDSSIFEPDLVSDGNLSIKPLQSIQTVLSDYEITEDPWYIHLSKKNDPRSQRELAKLKLNQKTWCYKELGRIYNSACSVHMELGIWAVNYYLSEAVKNVRSLGSMNESLFFPGNDTLQTSERNHLSKIMEQIETYESLPRDIVSISNKVSKVIDILHKLPSDSSGIVFVQERVVAITLTKLLTIHPLTRNRLRVGSFVGTSNYETRSVKPSEFIDKSLQANALSDFKTGKINILIATSVLEEGIDVPICNLVLCFQKPANLKSFVQRRGRARHVESKMILLIDSLCKNQITQFEELEMQMKEIYSDESRSLQEQSALEEEDSLTTRFFRVEKSGAVLDLDNAVSHLYHFCNTIPTDKFVDRRPEFINSKKNGKYRCKVILPLSVHETIRTAESLHAWGSEKNAIKDAAFEAYIGLYNAGLVSDNMLPVMKADMTSGLDATIETRPSLVSVRMPMNPWIDVARAWTDNLSTLYRSTVTFDGLNVGLFSPIPMPGIKSIPIYWDNDTTINISISDSPTSMNADSYLLTHLQEETSALFLSAFPTKNFCVEELVLKFQINQDKPLNSMLECRSVPENVSTIKDLGLIRDHQNIAYMFRELLPHKPDSRSVRKLFEGYENFPSEVSYLSLHRLPRRLDFLHPVAQDAQPTSEKLYSYVLPVQNCRMDRVPFRVVQFGMMVPCIIRQIEIRLIASKLCQELLSNIQVSDLSLVLTAICASNANEATNYQRLEFLGDTVLKTCVSIHIMAKNPLWHEGTLSLQKDHLVSNSRLARAAIEVGLDKYIINRKFTGAKWKPINVKDILGVLETERREMSTKTLADVVESLIGACMLDGGFQKALACLEVFLPELKWQPLDVCRTSLYDQAPHMVRSPKLEPVESILGYTFEKQSLLVEALSHPSYHLGSSSYERLEFLGDSLLDFIIVQEMIPHNLSHIRMHELRTAIVNADFLATISMELHYSREVNDIKPSYDAPGQKDSYKFAIPTCTPHTRYVKVPLYRFMRHNSVPISTLQNETFQRYSTMRDEIKYAFENGTQYPWSMLSSLKVEKFFSDMIEALLGAVWIDSGSLTTVREVIKRMGILDLLHRAIAEKMDLEHPKIRLGKLADQEKVHYVFEVGEGGAEPKCSIKIGEVLVASICGGYSRFEMETRAAINAIEFIKKKSCFGDQADLKE
ncbi:Bgt-5504 [Blumeria graminis f. sp. tritici]|uniref:Bgt-5504 n=2 Tax=Blumeria graminis f. sp. tritici TaxID=62690 RepID=A0A061HRU6_BLUGR|nr:DEAH family helicase [Blumeria graminis f. sp. tritici 96224]VCU41234.1 Bgt-5504 [Blumeria graminis f. sp. tritici]